jgi:hypothetical protein
VANVFAAPDRFILDTAGSTLLKAALSFGLPDQLRIKGIRWVKPGGANETVVIQDVNSVVLWESIASGANYVESDLTERRWYTDFKITTLGAGRVYLYLATGPGMF